MPKQNGHRILFAMPHPHNSADHIVLYESIYCSHVYNMHIALLYFIYYRQEHFLQGKEGKKV